MADLRSELNVKNLHLRNRLVLPPMASETSEGDGLVTERLLRYYAEKAAGGCLGLVITEHCYIMPEGKASPGQISVASDETVSGLRQLTDTLHGCGVPCVCQINHAGGRAKQSVTGLPSAAPSAVWADGTRFADRELTKADIQTVVAAFAAAAKRAMDAGYDGVEIHSAHSYLLNQFYSPLSNRRGDAYGGTLANRLRIHFEVLEAVRAAVGADTPVFLRLGSIDDRPGGSELADAVEASRLLAEAGTDVLDISGGFCGFVLRGREQEQGYFSFVSEAIREAVAVPVILTGGITSPLAADRLLREGKADLIGVGRAVLMDSRWPEKAFAELR